MKAQYPAPITDFEIRFWRYTLTDLARIGIPCLTGFLVAGLPGAVVGVLAGFGLAELQVHGKTLDQVLVSYAKFRIEESQLDVELEIHDQVGVLSDGTVIGLVEVDSVDLNMASEHDWRVNRDTVADLYREIEDSIEIHSRKRRVDLSGYTGIRDSAVTTDHFIAVKESPGSGTESVDDVVETVVDRCRMIRNSLNAGDLSAEHLTGTRLENSLNRFNPEDLAVDHSRYTVDEDSHRRVLYISKYPEERAPGLLSDILNMNAPGFVDVVQTVEPVSDKQRKKLSRLIGRMQAETVATPDPLRRSEIDRQLADAQNLIDVEESGDERLVNAGAYIVARGNSREQVDDTVEEVKRLLRRFSIEFEEPWLETPQTVQSESPLYPDRLDRKMIMPSRSAASSFSFSTHDKFEDGGISFGIDTRNGMPVILDRYCWEASHIARMGKIGSGKSYFAKLSLLRSWQTYSNLQIYIVDPKQEYGGIVDALDGETVVLDEVDLAGLETGAVTRFTVADRSRDNTDHLTAAVRQIYQTASENETPTIALVDEAHRLLSDAGGRIALGELVREGRDRNISVEMITQNASDFTRSQEGRDILKNVNCYIFMQHQDVETGVSDFFNLSQRETVSLRRLRTGTDLPFSEAIIRGPVNTKLRIEAAQQEHSQITSEPSNNHSVMNRDDASADNSESKHSSRTEAAIELSQTDGGVSTENGQISTGNGSAQVSESQIGFSSSHRRRGSADTFMELPDTCVTREEDPDADASAEEMLPEVLPGWKLQKTDTNRWRVPVAEDWITATYTDSVGDRYMVHVSKWSPEHVRYAIDEFYGIGEPVRFDVWTARGRFVFGVKVADGTLSQAKMLLTASPALSKTYLEQ